MKKVIIFFLLISLQLFSQKKVNNYKYVIVPKQFDFVKNKDGYRTSSLTKFLFNKYGFTAYLSDEILPNDLEANKCLALTANVKNNSNFFTTKNIIELKDCNGNLIFTAKEGKSKLKDYKKAYHQAIRRSFQSIKNLNYSYQPSKTVSSVEKIIEVSEEEVLPKKVQTVNTTFSKKVNQKSSLVTLYAQENLNGFQLVNTKPKVVFQLLRTNVKDVFIVKNGNGIFYKNNDFWVAEYYRNNKKVIETYSVKF